MERITHKTFAIIHTLLVLVVVFAFTHTTVAAPNYEINYQGKLTTPANVAVENGVYNMRFWLLTSPTVATTSAVWTESLTGANRVQVTNGLFSVMLGSTTPLTGVDFNQTLYLGVEIGGTTTPSWDGEMSPRKILGTVPAAFYAETASTSLRTDTLDGLDSTQFVRTDEPSEIASTSASTLFTVTQSGAGNIFDLYAGASNVFTVTSGGRVGIGTTTPYADGLTVDGDFALSGGLFDNNATRGSNGQILQTTGSGVQWIATSTLGIALSDTAGILGGTRGGTGLSSVAQNQLLIGGAGDTWTQIGTSSLGLGNGTFLGLSDTPSSYTANRILYQAASAVTDSANFTFDGTQLSVNGDVRSGYFTATSTTGTSTFAGRVGIGTSSPWKTLSVIGDMSLSGALFDTASTSGTSGMVLQTTGTSTRWVATSSLGISGGVADGMSNWSYDGTALRPTTTTAGILLSGSSTIQNLTMVNSTTTNATTTNLRATQFALGTDAITDLTGSGLTVTGNALTCVTGDSVTFGCLTGADWLVFNGKISSTSLDTSAELAALLTDETGTGSVVFSSSPTFTGGATFAGINVTASSTLGYASSTALTVSGNAFFNFASSSYASTTGITAQNAYIGNRLGIGTTTPSAHLTIQGVAGNVNTFQIASSTGSTTLAMLANGNLELPGQLISAGINWINMSATASDLWQAVAYGNGLFVSLSWNGTIMTSPDGVTWTSRTSPALNQWFGVTYGNGLFVAVSANGTNRVMTSPDGITWTTRTAAEANQWMSVTYGNGLFVAVADSGTNRVMTSPDGITWTARSASEANAWKSVTYGNGLFVAVACGYNATSCNNTVGGNRVMTSSDGISWTARSAAGDNDSWSGISYGNGLFVAVSCDGAGGCGASGDRVMTSSDGISWTARSAAGDNDGWFGVTYGNGLFVSVGVGTDRVMTSPDGIIWTPRAVNNGSSWIAVTYGNGRFVSVANFGTNRVMTSGMTEFNQLAHNNIYQGGMSVLGGAFNIGTTTATTSVFRNNVLNIASTTGTSLLTLTQAGRLGLGTTTPGQLLSVAGGMHLTGALYDRTYNQGTNGMVLQTTGSGVQWVATSTLGISGVTTIAGLSDVNTSGAASGTVLVYDGTTWRSRATSTLGISGGVADGASHWLYDGSRLTPSSTIGIGVFASSTIGGGTGATGLTIAGNSTTTLNAYIAGTLGIGTTSPSAKLSVTGTAGSQNLFAFASSTGSNLLTLGADGRMTFGNSATANILMNGGATSSNPTLGISNVAIGNQAFSYYTAGANYNIALGEQSLYGSSSVPMTGYGNFAAGYQALGNNTTGYSNNALGFWSLINNTTGSNNNAFGDSSLFSNTTGSNNNAIGNYSLYSNTTGLNNSAIGISSLYFNTTGTGNNALGFWSLINNTTGSYNLALGDRAGYNHTTGTSTSYLGAFTNTINGAVSSSTALGAGAILAVSNSMVLGGTGANAVDIVTGTSTPWAKFSIMNNHGATSALFDIATTTSATFATSSLFRVGHDGRVSIGSSTPEGTGLTIDRSGLTGAQVAGIKQYLGFTNATQNAVYYGDNTYIVNAPTATSTLIGSILRIQDDTTLGNTVRGMEIQANRGGNTKGENTGLSAFGRTFGVRGITEGDAGELFTPAGVYAESRGTAQGNAFRAYSGTITSSTLAQLFQTNSAFTGTGLQMNFGNGTGTFSGANARFLDLQTAGVSKLVVTADGKLGIGTTTPAQLLTVAGGAHLTGALYDRTYNQGTNGMVLQTTGSGVQWVATSTLGLGGSGATTLAALTDVSVGGAASGTVLVYDGTTWQSRATSTLGITGAGSSNWTDNGTYLSTLTGGDGIIVAGSSTIGAGTGATGLTIFGNSTTTLNAYIGGSLGIGTTSTSSIMALTTNGEKNGSHIFEAGANPEYGGLIGGFKSLQVLETVDESTYWNLGYINRQQGSVANYVTTSSTLEFIHYSTNSDMISANYLLSYGGYGYLPQDGSYRQGIFSLGQDRIGIGSINSFASSTLNTPVIVLDTVTESLGIGTTSPSATLSVTGTAGSQNLFAFASSTGSTLLALQGDGRLMFGTTTGANIFLNGGPTSTNPLLSSNTNNIAIGNRAYSYVGSGATDNIALGRQALYGSSSVPMTGDYNFAVGSSALKVNTTGGWNNAVGQSALLNNTTGSSNNAFGWDTLFFNTSGYGNNAMSYQALYFNTTGSYNNAIGEFALTSNTTGSYNNAIGYAAIDNNITGSYNNAFGYNTLGSYNGTGTIGIGYQAGDALTNGDRNIIIGYNNDFMNASTSFGLNIGNIIYGTGVDGEGTTHSSGNIGIGTSSPSAKLTITGSGSTNPFLVASSSGSSLLTVLANGNVGIGTSTPSAKLAVNGQATPIGPELITNGTFTGNANGWGLQSGCSAYNSNNVTALYDAGCQAGANWAVATTSFATEAGKTYLLTFTLSNANDMVIVNFDNNNDNSVFGPHVTGAHSLAFVSNYTGTETIYFESWNYVNGTGWTLDDVSIKEVSTITPAFAVTGYDGLTWLSLGGDLLYNTALGKGTLAQNTTGNNNSLVGDFAGYSNTVGYNNSFVGSKAGFSNTTGAANSFVGEGAGFYNTTGAANSFVGLAAGYKNTTGNNNSFLGGYVGYENTTGSNNSAFGLYAGYGLGATATSSGNLFLGYRAGFNQTRGDNNIVIGYDVTAASTTGSNQLSLGNLIYGTGLTGTGSTISPGSIGIGTTSPASKLDVWGSFRVGTTSTSTLYVGTGNGRVGVGTTTPYANLTVAGSLGLTGTFFDRTQSAGTNGMVLQTTGSGVQWVATSTLGLSGASFSDSAGLAALLSDETGTGAAVFAGSPTFTGGATFAGINVTASSTLGYASSTALTVSGNSYFNFASSSYASTTGLTAQNAYIGNRLGIGTTSPSALLALLGTSGQTAPYFRIASSSGDVLFEILADGSVSVGDGALYYDSATQVTSIDNLNLGTMNFDTDGGALTWVDMLASSSATGTVLSYSANIDSNPLLTIYGESNGQGGVQNLRVGIGSTTPSSRLTVMGDSNTDNLFAFASSTGSTLLSLRGDGRLMFGTTTSANIFLNGGPTSTNPMITNSTNNVAIGNEAFSFVGSGATDNIALGYQALYGSSSVPMTGDYNFAVGSSALKVNTTGGWNNALGQSALLNNTTGSSNNAFGWDTLFFNTSGYGNNAMSYQALYFNTTGSYNNAIGESALASNTTGSYNNAIGYAAIDNNITGSYNNAFGYNTLGSYNGTGTIGIGYQAGDALTNGDRNIIIGYNNDFANASTSFGLNIGNIIYGTGVDGEGTTHSSGNIGIGTSTPGQKLSVAGGMHLTGALYDRTYNQGTNGMVLQTTGSGVQWVATSTLGLGGSGATTLAALTDVNTSGAASGTVLVYDGTTWQSRATSTLGITGVADGASHWLYDGTRLTPSSTVGIGVFASSTIGDGSATGGLTISGNSTTTLNAYIAGTLGIGTTSPSAKLSVTGTAGSQNLFAFASSTGSNLLTLGADGRLIFGTTTNANIFMNGGATSSNPALGSRNIAIGSQSFSYYGAGAVDNIALGYQALYGSSSVPMTGDDNFAAGYQAGYNNTTGTGNTFIGYDAGYNNTTGSYNLALGESAGRHNTIGSYNSFIGYDAGYANTTGSNNFFAGQLAGTSNTTGSYNLALGESAGFFNTTGSYNFFAGRYAGYNNTTGTSSVAIGTNALYTNTTGSYNLALGDSAGYNHTTGSSTSYLGAFTNTINGAVSSSTALGAGAILARSNTMVLGGTGASAVDIVSGTSTPWAKLSIMNNYGSTTALFDIATTTSATFATSSLFRVNHNGMVGIGTSSPSRLLTVQGEGYFAGNLTATGTARFANLLVTGSSTIGGATGATGLTINGSATTTLNAYIAGTLGIGTTSPSAKLSVTGTAGSQNLFAFASSTGSTLLSLRGDGRLVFGTTTSSNIFLNGGPTSTNPLDSWNTNNVAIGNQAFSYVGSGATDNIALGYQALYGSSSVPMTGDYNIALGYQAGLRNTTGIKNIFAGFSAGSNNTTGSNNIALGNGTMELNRSGSYNTAFNEWALRNNTVGTYNFAVGYQALELNTLGSHNIGIGRQTLENNTTGSDNIALGDGALQSNNGDKNIAIGEGALSGMTGSNTIAIGAYAGWRQNSGNNNLFIGYNTQVASTTGSNQFSIANIIYASGLGQGDLESHGIVSIGTSTPWAKLSIQNNYGSTTALFDIATTTSAAYATSSLFRVGHDGRVSMGSTSPEGTGFTIDKSGITGSVIAGMKQYLGFTNTTESAVYYGNANTFVNAPTATSTFIGNITRIFDNSGLGNTVRGMEIQAHRGTTTKGENTGLSAFGRTFGIRGTTEGDAGDTFSPAGVFAETRGSTQGNALRAYSGSITTSALVSLFHDTSAFSGTGLLMNFGNSGGTFAATSSGKFIDLQNNGTSKFMVTAAGTTTIGDGTTNNMAGLQIGFGGLCVDNDGTCNASTTGRITSVSSATGNSDLAEMYFSADDLLPGDIVMLEGGLSVARAQGARADRAPIVGVVSTKPGLLLGFDDSPLIANESAYPIALKGRVPIRLSTENGPIVKGDRITLSSIPGVGMKATESDTVVGIALEDWNGEFAYTDGFVNQFGDDIARAKVTPLNQNTDLRTQDGCYFGAGNELGEEECDPKAVKAPKTPKESREDHLRAVKALALEPAETMVLDEGETEVAVGQALMFVQLEQHIVMPEMDILAALNSTSTLGNSEGETLFDRLKTLAQGFVDGVLTLAEVVAERFTAEEVQTEMLCVGETCIDEATLKALLKAQGETGSAPAPTPEPEPEPPLEPVDTEGTGSTGASPEPQVEPADNEGTDSNGASPTPEPEPVVEETPAPVEETPAEPEPVVEEAPAPEPTPEPAPAPTESAEVVQG